MVIRLIAMGVAALATAMSVPTPAQTPTVESVPTPTTTIEPSPSGEATLAFVGDVHFERHLLRYLRPGGLRPVEPLWGDADLVIANLETAITSAGQHQEKIYNFRAPAKTVKALQQAGVGVVSMANNHALDYGRSGLADTLAAFSDASIAAVGIGADRAAALAPYRIDLNDRGGSGGVTPLSIFGVATSEMLSGLRWAAEPDRGGIVVWEAHRTALLRAIRSERDSGRVVVVYVHWGREGETCPTTTQRRVAASLEQAGATIIVGAHPHVLQGIGRSEGGALVAYSLGNFIWYNAKGGLTGVLTVRLRDGKVDGVDFTPARLSTSSSTLGLPRRSPDQARVFSALARCADLNMAGR